MPGVFSTTLPSLRVRGVPGGTPVLVASGKPQADGWGMQLLLRETGGTGAGLGRGGGTPPDAEQGSVEARDRGPVGLPRQPRVAGMESAERHALGERRPRAPRKPDARGPGTAAVLAVPAE
jgi:hypothetical protein